MHQPNGHAPVHGGTVRPELLSDEHGTMDARVHAIKAADDATAADLAATFRATPLPYATETVADALARPPVPSVVEGIVPGGGRLVEVIAPRGVGKSMLALSLALACHAGHGGWLGHRLLPVPTVFVPLEGPYTVAPRATAWAQEHGVDVSGFTYVAETRLGLLADRGARLAATVRERDAGLVVLDAWRQLLEGASDEDRDVAPALLDVVQQVAADTAATVVLLHNSGWAEKGRARGLSVFEDAADVVLTLAGDADGVKVEVTKNRLGPQLDPWWFTLAPDGVPRRSGVPGGGADERGLRLEMRILDTLRGHPDGLRRTELRDLVGGSRPAVYAAVDALVGEDRISEERAVRGSVTVSRLSLPRPPDPTGPHRTRGPVANDRTPDPTLREGPVRSGHEGSGEKTGPGPVTGPVRTARLAAKVGADELDAQRHFVTEWNAAALAAAQAVEPDRGNGEAPTPTRGERLDLDGDDS